MCLCVLESSWIMMLLVGRALGRGVGWRISNRKASCVEFGSA